LRWQPLKIGMILTSSRQQDAADHDAQIMIG
jgi:hypothetical protein